MNTQRGRKPFITAAQKRMNRMEELRNKGDLTLSENGEMVYLLMQELEEVQRYIGSLKSRQEMIEISIPNIAQSLREQAAELEKMIRGSDNEQDRNDKRKR